MTDTTQSPRLPQDPPVELSDSERFRMLSSKRRRVVIEILDDTARPMELSELADAVVDREFELMERSTTRREHVLISLYHNHLPHLDNLGVISFDPDERLVEPTAWNR